GSAVVELGLDGVGSAWGASEPSKLLTSCTAPAGARGWSSELELGAGAQGWSSGLELRAGAQGWSSGLELRAGARGWGSGLELGAGARGWSSGLEPGYQRATIGDGF
ncbi:hypothetical protein NHX12_032584, partial [Muraenolepis orangiensis]